MKSNLYQDIHIPGPWIIFWQQFHKHKLAVAGLFCLIIIFAIAILSPFMTPYDPNEQFSNYLRVPPIWHEGGSSRFLFGTDDLGRDLLSRIMSGAQLSLGLSAIVVFSATIIGVVLGAICGIAKGMIEFLILRIMDIFLSIPSLLLAVLIVAILEPGLYNAIYAVALVLIPHFVRIVRAIVKEELVKDYVIAARLDGIGTTRLFIKIILPNLLPPLIVQITLSFSTALIDITALGFLGLGAQAPTPEWGSILSQSKEFIQLAPWTVTIPGFAIFISVLSINLVGDGLRSALDAKSLHT